MHADIHPIPGDFEPRSTAVPAHVIAAAELEARLAFENGHGTKNRVLLITEISDPRYPLQLAIRIRCRPCGAESVASEARTFNLHGGNLSPSYQFGVHPTMNTPSLRKACEPKKSNTETTIPA